MALIIPPNKFRWLFVNYFWKSVTLILLELRSRKTTSAFPCCYALDLLGLVDGEMYDKWKVKVDTTQINFKELYFR